MHARKQTVRHYEVCQPINLSGAAPISRLSHRRAIIIAQLFSGRHWPLIAAICLLFVEENVTATRVREDTPPNIVVVSGRRDVCDTKRHV